MATFKAIPSIFPPPGSILAARALAAGRRAWLFALLVALCFLYAFIGAAGTSRWPVYGIYHDLQADGFLQGHTHLPIAPAPELLAAKNPYDPVNIDYWYLDASYYGGKYYMYWGPVPALLEAAVKWTLGIQRSLGDQYLAVFFHCLTLCCGALLIERLVTRLFSSKARSLIALGVLVFALANPSPHGVATSSTYQAAIIAAQAWLCAGLLFAFDAVWHAGTPDVGYRRHLLAGTCWALALGSRVSVLPALALLVPLTAWFETWPGTGRARRFFVGSVCLGAPLAATGFGLLAYNKLRFDDWLEFGSNIQLSGFPLIHFSSDYVLANLYSYLFRPWAGSCEFPYLQQVWNMGPAAFPGNFSLAADYEVVEPVVGWVLAVPLAWLIPFAFVCAPRPSRFSGRRDRAYWFCLISFTVLASATGVITLFIYGATMRYLNDVTTGIVLLAVLGSGALRFHRWGLVAPRASSALIGGLGIATMLIGLLLGYQGYNRHFHLNNPELDKQVVTALSMCGTRAPDETETPEGGR